ncbi:MAG: putative Co/Zn/Cd efflux system rane fusion protein, partial [Myxococcaceae bacterium]|nr:putative Co/Zn/Cd efflux system rane fusion protein [Myxococcaceae bacterium]
MIVGALALAAIVLFLRYRAGASQRGATATREAAATQDRPVPVLVATVEQRDVPLYLEGLGTVAAYNTVTVRARVEGRLDAVAFAEGQTVHRGDLLAQIDPRPFAIALRQAEAVVARDRALVAANRRTYERNRALLAQSFIAQADVDAALGALEQSQAAQRADEATASSARLNLDWARITSPIDGVVGLRQVDPGNVVRPSDVNGIVLVRQVDPIAVMFTLPQDELPRVAAEMARGVLPVDVFSRDGATRLASGSLAVVDNQINAATASLRLKAVFANPTRALWPDQFVKTRLLLTTVRGALVVPAAAVQRGPQGTFAYLVGGDQRVAIRVVQVGRIEGETAIIAGGLAAGDRVVVEGTSRLRAGARVQSR